MRFPEILRLLVHPVLGGKTKEDATNDSINNDDSSVHMPTLVLYDIIAAVSGDIYTGRPSLYFITKNRSFSFPDFEIFKKCFVAVYAIKQNCGHSIGEILDKNVTSQTKPRFGLGPYFDT